MEKHGEKSHQEIVAELDARVEKMGQRLREEGFKFGLEIPNESIIILRVGGKEFNFTKKEQYDVKAADGSYSSKDIEEIIAERIREFGK